MAVPSLAKKGRDSPRVSSSPARWVLQAGSRACMSEYFSKSEASKSDVTTEIFTVPCGPSSMVVERELALATAVAAQECAMAGMLQMKTGQMKEMRV